jgi:phage terminase Nu1 subunit (DNA packaging protein)
MPGRHAEGMEERMVSAIELGEYLGVAERTVRDWVRKGILPEPNRGQYGIKACTVAAINHFKAIAERTERAGGSADQEDPQGKSIGQRRQEAECRLAEAKAEAEELRLQELAGQLVKAEDVRAVGAAMVAAFRQKILTLPSAVAAQVRETPDPRSAEILLRQRCLEALDELAKWSGDGDGGDGDAA